MLFSVSKEDETQTDRQKRKTKMHINLHDVVSIELEAVKDLTLCKTRKLYIKDANGNKFELTLFADSEEALQIKA